MTPAAAEATRRLFFALWPASAVRHELALAVATACPAGAGCVVPEENLHLTLVFLGSVPQRRLPELARIGRDCAETYGGTESLQLRFSKLEYWSEAQVLVASASSAEAERLAEALRAAAAAAGFTPDLKSFRAHVTVARKVARPPTIASLRPLEWRCDAFALMDSRTGSGGPVYSVVGLQTLVKTKKPHE